MKSSMSPKANVDHLLLFSWPGCSRTIMNDLRVLELGTLAMTVFIMNENSSLILQQSFYYRR